MPLRYRRGISELLGYGVSLYPQQLACFDDDEGLAVTMVGLQDPTFGCIEGCCNHFIEYPDPNTGVYMPVLLPAVLHYTDKLETVDGVHAMERLLDEAAIHHDDYRQLWRGWDIVPLAAGPLASHEHTDFAGFTYEDECESMLIAARRPWDVWQVTKAQAQDLLELTFKALDKTHYSDLVEATDSGLEYDEEQKVCAELMEAGVVPHLELPRELDNIWWALAESSFNGWSRISELALTNTGGAPRRPSYRQRDEGKFNPWF